MVVAATTTAYAAGGGRRASLPRRSLCSVLIAALLAAGCGMAVAGRDPEPTTTVAILSAFPVKTERVAVFREELRRAGFTSRQVVILGADEVHPEPEDAEAAVRRWAAGGVDVIVALWTEGARIASRHAPDTWILFVSNDAEAAGLVDDASAPSGNLTGITFRVPADRMLALAAQAVPELRVVGLIHPATDPAAGPHREAVAAAADRLGFSLVTAAFWSADTAGDAIARLALRGADAVVVANAPATIAAADMIEEGAFAAGVPLVANTGMFAGAVVVVEPNALAVWRQLGRQAAQLLSGAAPAQVPVEEPATYDVVVNGHSAAQLGLTIPRAVLRQADRVVTDSPS